MKVWQFPIHRWVNQIALDRLEDAYQGALVIKEIEDKHFEGDRIGLRPGKGKTVCDYFRTQLERELARIRLSLTQFRLSGFFISRPAGELGVAASDGEGNGAALASTTDPETLILEKLTFIETVVSKYRQSQLGTNASHKLSTPPDFESLEAITPEVLTPISASTEATNFEPENKASTPSMVPLESVLKRIHPERPNSFLERMAQIGKQLSPEYEQEVIRELRAQRQQNRTAIRWLLLLLILPLLVQVLTHNLIFEPLLNAYGKQNYAQIELNEEIVEESLAEFTRLKETLEVKELLGLIPPQSQSEQADHLTEAAREIMTKALYRSLDGWKNLLSDGVSLMAFAGLVYLGRDKLMGLRRFSNQTFLSLSDPAKVFLFILVTDMFVGFHSAEGWEVILEGTLRHFGLPESKGFIYLFIATIPVIMDSCIKFWIFNYLTRFSPSTSAIYERMNT
ncbi:hypothetical protein DO97_04700 [Neosynechococcus sphagnicola sy1]|uniref:Uncharacterized protein n=1 Tax=Neosynechococcus sphagnicola sy1 TaxID=1497020 RepID=A0A098TPM9_9CYAN|nr:hypothetical protein [Neosynechococcus sphagnicola]KGF72788.1 hypothetical protein DO97_04700 [Neosynechococcus sphagnicola sy1]